MSLRKKDDWDEALEEAHRAQGYYQTVDRPNPADYEATVTVPREEIAGLVVPTPVLTWPCAKSNMLLSDWADRLARLSDTLEGRRAELDARGELDDRGRLDKHRLEVEAKQLEARKLRNHAKKLYALSHQAGKLYAAAHQQASIAEANLERMFKHGPG